MAYWVPVLLSFPLLLTLLKLWVHDLLLLKQQPLPCSKRICNKHVPCVNQLLSHQSMPQKNIPAKPTDKLLEIFESPVLCPTTYCCYTADALHPLLGMEITAVSLQFYISFQFNISICCPMLYLYGTHRREHFVFLCAKATAKEPWYQEYHKNDKNPVPVFTACNTITWGPQVFFWELVVV